jgi:hypothetical protein
MENEQQTVTSTPQVVPLVQKIDTHSYKGWLNSDSFLKRAFAVYGYSMVAGLIVAIPIMVICFVIGFALFSTLMVTGVNQREQYVTPQQEYPAEKLNIDIVCRNALSYTDFPDAASANVFIEECKQGMHPEVIERYKSDMGVGDGRAI